MKKVFAVLMLIAVSGCEFDTGSNSYTKSIGQSISLECFKSNLKSVAGLEIGSEASDSMVLIGPGIDIRVEFESVDSVVNAYSVVTKTEKSKDGGVHHSVTSAISLPCTA